MSRYKTVQAVTMYDIPKMSGLFNSIYMHSISHALVFHNRVQA